MLLSQAAMTVRCVRVRSPRPRSQGFRIYLLPLTHCTPCMHSVIASSLAFLGLEDASAKATAKAKAKAKAGPSRARAGPDSEEHSSADVGADALVTTHIPIHLS